MKPVRPSARPVLRALLILAVVSLPFAASAHHPGADLDRAMGSREKYFETKDRPAPDFTLVDADGAPVSLADLAGKIVVLHFIYAGCPDVCPLHAEKLATVQEMINGTPMKDVVRFVSITTDPERDTPEILRSYGPDRGLDPATWMFLTRAPRDPESATRTLAEAFGHKFTRTDEGYQAHSVVTHIIDGNARWAANFHGLRFEPVNMVLYVNGLINNPPGRKAKRDAGFWSRLRDLF